MAPPAKPTPLFAFATLLLLLPLAGCYYPAYYYNSAAGYGGYYARPVGYARPYGYPYGYGYPYFYSPEYYNRPYGYYYGRGYYGYPY
jgi:hypothetical protein